MHDCESRELAMHGVFAAPAVASGQRGRCEAGSARSARAADLDLDLDLGPAVLSSLNSCSQPIPEGLQGQQRPLLTACHALTLVLQQGLTRRA